MPLIDHSFYKPPVYLRNGHLQILLTTLLRQPESLQYQRERIETPDGDFLDLDWLRQDSPRLAILCHGLEGNSRSSYILGMAAALYRRGWDVLAWNFRSCSGTMNRTSRFYHSGATDDLETVLKQTAQSHPAQQIALIGFSLGGNLLLKYIGERPPDARITKAVAFSVPIDLSSSARQLAQPQNRIYMRHFLKSLREKVLLKKLILPSHLRFDQLSKIRTFHEFDEYFTAPLHGFKSAEDYYLRCSAIHYFSGIQIPTLLVNARNDPFLSPACFPTEIAQKHPYLYLETPSFGGHCGFLPEDRQGECWSESRALAFLEEEHFAEEKLVQF
ncbi:MAG: alpha/beta fold hydrolase [Verrucomicrobiota bacterium]